MTNFFYVQINSAGYVIGYTDQYKLGQSGWYLVAVNNAHLADFKKNFHNYKYDSTQRVLIYPDHSQPLPSEQIPNGIKDLNSRVDSNAAANVTGFNQMADSLSLQSSSTSSNFGNYATLNNVATATHSLSAANTSTADVANDAASSVGNVDSKVSSAVGLGTQQYADNSNGISQVADSLTNVTNSNATKIIVAFNQLVDSLGYVNSRCDSLDNRLSNR